MTCYDNISRLQRISETHRHRLQLDIVEAELASQKKSTERLRRDLSDFRAMAPEAEEIKEEVLKKIQKDRNNRLCVYAMVIV